MRLFQFDHEILPEFGILFTRVSLWIANHPGSPNPVVAAVVEVPMHPHARLMPKNEFVQIGSISATERFCTVRGF